MKHTPESAIARSEGLSLAVARSADLLFSSEDFTRAMSSALEILGGSSGVDRVRVFENRKGAEDDTLASQRFEWVRVGIPPQVGCLDLHALPLSVRLPRWLESLSENIPVAGSTRDFPESEHIFLEAQGVLSIAILPVNSSGRLWGFVTFDTCRQEREWDPLDIEILRGAAAAIGGALILRRGESARLELDRFFTLSAGLLAVFSEDGHFLRTNTGWSMRMGYEPESLLGCRWVDLVYPDDAEASLGFFKRTKQGPVGTTFTNRIRDHRGGYHWLRWSAVFDPTVHLVFAEAIIIDDLKQAEIELTRANLALQAQAEDLRRGREGALNLMEDARRAERAAEAANIAKSAFLAVMSHEIRTPLNGVIGFTDLLLGEDLKPAQHEYAQTIKSCGTALLALISDILDISKIESGRLELDLRSGQIVPLARGVLEAFSKQASDKGIALGIRVGEGVPDCIVTDHARLRQILYNLVGNAVKFTGHGHVKMRIRSKSGAKPDLLHLDFEVEDTGIGISPEQVGKIFEPFSQANASVHRKYGGTGLGLAISQKLATLMDGQIRVTSNPKGGSIFTLSIEASSAGSRPPSFEIVPPPRKKLAHPTPVEGTRIAVVDDVALNLRLAVKLLERLGYQAKTYSSGEEAIDGIRRNPVDIIFMDVLMPGLDGCETARQLKSPDTAATSPSQAYIVALTADAMLENRQRCLSAGMDDFITKPLRLEELREALSRGLASRKSPTPK